MSANNWAHVRLSVSVHPDTRGGQGRLCADFRLLAKAPGDQWSERATVAHGTERIEGIPWPLSRDDALAVMTEVLMGIRWTEPPF